MAEQNNQSDSLFGQTPWQTVGPFFHYSLAWRGGADLTGQSDLGARLDLLLSQHEDLLTYSQTATSDSQHIKVIGRILDGQSDPVPDALIECWQADHHGEYRQGLYGRCATDEDGRFVFHTVKPGPVTDEHGPTSAPYISFLVLARGVIKGLQTRMYFEGEALNTSDPVLQLLPPPRAATLVSRFVNEHWHFDIHLQGPNETVFFK